MTGEAGRAGGGVCECVCVRERERDRETDRPTHHAETDGRGEGGRLCLNYVLREEAGSCKKLFNNGIMDCDGDGELLEERRCFDNDQGMRFENFLQHR